MSDHDNPTEPVEDEGRTVALPAFRRIWLAPLPRRPEPVEDQQEGEPNG